MVVWGGLMTVSIGGLFLAGVVPGLLIALSHHGRPSTSTPGSTRLSGLRPRSLPGVRRTPVAQRDFLALMTPAIIVGGYRRRLLHADRSLGDRGHLLGRSRRLLIYRSITLCRAAQGPLRQRPLRGDFPVSASAPPRPSAGRSPISRCRARWWRKSRRWGSASPARGLMVAAAFLIIGMFIDAIPAIIILGTVLWPVATSVGMHPIHFAIIGVISLAFGLVTPPYGLCLLIACAVGKIKVVEALARRRHSAGADAPGAAPDHRAAGSDPSPAAPADAEIR